MLDLERPPRWAIAFLVALLAANGALLAYVMLRPAPVFPDTGAPSMTVSSGGSASAEPSGASTSAPVLDQSASTPVLAVYGDGYSTGSDEGGMGPAGWPALVTSSLDAELRLHAVSMAGYASPGIGGRALPRIISAAPEPDATVTIVFGSRNDLGMTADAVLEGADAALATIRSASPSTSLVVVGPAWSDAAVPEDLYAIRDAVRQAADRAGATFIDPLAEGWFQEPAGLIAADGISPTDAGHQYLATQITPIVAQLVTAD